MAKLIGTAGHVDHGKTALIQALTGIDADRLPEEKRRGMTIDIGFAHIDLPDVGRVSIVDVPGHERFLSNMLVGALGIEVAMLCVAADESVMPQTREHFQILELLPVKQMVVAVTKADLADAELREYAREEVIEMLGPTRFRESAIIDVSVRTGEGLENLRAELVRLLSIPADSISGSWYLPIDRVFPVKGHGTVVTGTLARGSVSAGDKAIIEPGGIEVRVRAIEWHEAPQDSAEAGRRTALNLAGLKPGDVHRGQAVGALGSVFETRLLDAKMRWIVMPKHAMRVRVSIGAAEAMGKLFLSDIDSDLGQLRLEQPVAAALGQPLIVRRYSPPDLLGGGQVVVPNARIRRRNEAPGIVERIDDDQEAAVEAVKRHPQGVATEEVCRLLGRSAQELGEVFDTLKSEGKLLGFGGLWFIPDSFDHCVLSLIRSLEELHEQSPSQAFIAREKAVHRAGLAWAGKSLDRIVATLAKEGRLRSSGTEIAAPEFRVKLSARQQELLDRTIAELDRQWPNVPSPREIATELGVPPQAIEEIAKVGLQARTLVRVAEDIYYSLAGVDRLKDAAREVSGGKPFPASAFRDRIGTTRKYAIPILEYLDSIRFTLRVGDERSIVG